MDIVQFLVSHYHLIFAGAVVGFIVGITGVGGGALMTPILLFFGIPPTTAIGTDLLYAAVTKGSGMLSHARQGHVNWSVMLKLSAGSLAGSILTYVFLRQYVDADYSDLLKKALGIMLVITAFLLYFRPYLKKFSMQQSFSQNTQIALTLFIGLFIGVFVTLSSVGAGAMATAALMILFPLLLPKEIVGTDIAHAVPLTLLAGIFHWTLGNVDWGLLVSLIIGSIPMVLLGSQFSSKIPAKVMHPFLASALLLLGLMYAFNLSPH